MIAADRAADKCEVHIFEKGKTVGRKFLVAGKGGFNLTNRATGAELLAHYTKHPLIRRALEKFGTEETRRYFADLGIPTFIGSSGRVFPERGIKPVQVLQALKKRLRAKGVVFHLRHEFVGFTEDMRPRLNGGDITITPEADAYVFALGGASWSVTGSTGDWLAHFAEKSIPVLPFAPSNCGVNVDWSPAFREKYAGQPLKNVAVTCRDKTVKGEVMISEYGLEGNAIYPLSPQIRESLRRGETPILHFDFKTQNSENQLLTKISGKKITPKNYGYLFNLNKSHLAFLKQFTTKEDYLSPQKFIVKIKKLPVPVRDLRPIEEAISVVGGIDLSAVTEDFALRAHPHLYVIGEMLNWDAPTGGFLLQGCFSTAVRGAEGILGE